MTASQPIDRALNSWLPAMSAKSIAAGSVVVSGSIPGNLAVPTKLRHHLRESRLMAIAGGRPFRLCMVSRRLLAASELCRHLLEHSLVPAARCLSRCLLLKYLLPWSVAANSQLRHRFFQCNPMTIGSIQVPRNSLYVWRWLRGCRLIPVLLRAPLGRVRPLVMNLLSLLLRCFKPLEILRPLLRRRHLLGLLNALLRSCCLLRLQQAFVGSCGLLHLLHALLRNVCILQTLLGRLGLLDVLLRPLQSGFRLLVVARAPVAVAPIGSFRMRRRNDQVTG
jgi:hypothetical protein